MDQSILISTALISSLWDKYHKDTFDLMLPFLKYAIGKETTLGAVVDVESVVELYKKEYGYEQFPRNIINPELFTPVSVRRLTLGKH